jgi:hypothetical protein
LADREKHEIRSTFIAQDINKKTNLNPLNTRSLGDESCGQTKTTAKKLKKDVSVPRQHIY